MFQITAKRVLNPTVTQMDILAPVVARKAKPGQSIILRVDSEGERIPLTVAGVDTAAGTVRIIFQTVGATTENPFFYVYNAILSRSTVFEFKELTPDDIVEPIKRAAEFLAEEKGIW